jgi:hypothetical protein
VTDNNERKYGRNRAEWRKVYSYNRRKPNIIETIDLNTSQSFSYDLQRIIRYRDYSLLSKPHSASFAFGGSEYDEGLVTLSSADTFGVGTFNFQFSGDPIIVLTVESASLYGPNLNLFGYNYSNTGFTFGLSAPFVGSIRYRASFTNVYPTYVSSFYSSSITASAGIVNPSGNNFYTASYAALPGSPFSFLDTTWNDLDLGDIDVALLTDTSSSSNATINISDHLNSNVHFMAFYNPVPFPSISISGDVSISGSLIATGSDIDSYQWQRGSTFDGGGTYTDIVGATNSTYSPEADDIGYDIICIGTNVVGSATSNVLIYSMPTFGRNADFNADVGVIKTGVRVISVEDQFGFGHNLGMETDDNRPLLSIGGGPNGHDAFDFAVSGVFGKALTGSLTSSPSGSYYVVGQIPAPSRYFYDNFPGGNIRVCANIGSNMILFAGGSACSIAVPVTGSWIVNSAIWAGASSKQSINNDTAATGDPGTAAAAGFTMGNYAAVTVAQCHDAKMSRAVLYHNVHTDSQRADLTAYLMNWAAI